MLTAVEKDYKICSQRNKKEKYFIVYILILNKSRMHLGNRFIKYHNDIEFNMRQIFFLFTCKDT